MDQEQWNQFVVKNGGCFLQSFEWGQFQQSLGRKIWRINIEDKIVALIIKNPLPWQKNYLYCPQGPIIKDNQAIGLFLNQIQEIGQTEKAIFFKMEPDSPLALSEKFNLKRDQKRIQPKKTIILDILQSSEDLLSQMHQKTRYNIGLAQRRKVAIEIIDQPDKNNIETFWQLLSQTAKRDEFKLHAKEYYQKMLDVLAKEGLIKLFVAKYKNQIIAANIISFFGPTATYLHGASDYNFRRLMAPYLLQWQAILKAKAMGFKNYDFWGIDEKKWPGITRFKKGFDHREITYDGAYDLVFRPAWYRLYAFAKKIL